MKTKFKKMGLLETIWNSLNAGVVFCYGVHNPNNCSHGPQEWSRYKIISFTFARLMMVEVPSTGYRIWIYTKKRAFFFDVYFDRRKWPDGTLYAKTNKQESTPGPFTFFKLFLNRI